MEKTVYAGTYTSHGSQGVYAMKFKDGVLADGKLFCALKNPKYITQIGNCIAACADFDSGSGIALMDRDGNILDTIAYEDRTSCYIAAKDNRLYTANYHNGTFSAVEVTENHTLKLIETVEIQDGAGCHQVMFWKDMILVPSLFLDRVMLFDKDLKRAGSIRFSVGTGPRHGVFTKDEEYLYLVSELSNELFVIHAGDWEIQEQIAVLKNNETHVRDTAAIRLDPEEKHIYVSTRTKDVLSMIELNDHHPELKQVTDCGGRHPRDFILCDGYLLCANRHTNEVVSFKLNDDGTIGRETSRLVVPEAVSLLAL